MQGLHRLISATHYKMTCCFGFEGLFMDMDLVHILDCNIVTLKPASRRRLQSTVPACVKKYLENVQKCWKSQNIENRAKSILQETIEHGMSAQLEQKLNNLDSNISEIMRHAEKNVPNCIVPSRMIGASSSITSSKICITNETKKINAEQSNQANQLPKPQ